MPELNPYEARQEERRERYQARAAKARREAEVASAQGRRISDAIPFGQPILLGHHSEGKHRRDLDRIQRQHQRTVDALNKADHYEAKAESVGLAGISSDDPDAIPKLKTELAAVLAKQKRMKAANAALRGPDSDARLAALGYTPERIAGLRTPDELGRTGYPDYALRNNGANARRIAKRITDLETRSKDRSSQRMVGNVRVVENVEANRLQLFFPGKPDEATRKKLKSYGFRWSPTAGAWQAFRSSRATWAAGVMLAESSKPEGQPEAEA